MGDCQCDALVGGLRVATTRRRIRPWSSDFLLVVPVATVTPVRDSESDRDNARAAAAQWMLAARPARAVTVTLARCGRCGGSVVESIQR